MKPRNLNVQIYHAYQRFALEIYVTGCDSVHVYNYTYENGEIVETKMEESKGMQNEYKPFLSLPKMFSDSFIKGIVQWASDNNIKTKDQTLIEGKLIATDSHLKDMQEITKKLLDHVTFKKP